MIDSNCKIGNDFGLTIMILSLIFLHHKKCHKNLEKANLVRYCLKTKHGQNAKIMMPKILKIKKNKNNLQMRKNLKRKTMNKKIDDFLDKTLFVKDIKCLFCDAELDSESRYCVCDDCFQKLPFLTGKVCKCCGEPINSLADYCMRCKNHIDRGFDVARAVFLYRNQISKAVKDLKYFGKKYYAEYLSKFLYDLYIKEGFLCDVVIPAPISQKSLKARGFNQSELLCKSFADNGFDINTTCTIKEVETENQVNLNFKERQTNLVGAFKVVDKSAIKNKNILLVDDIFTTGATMSEISETLKKAGAKSVFVITLCHEMPENKTN